MKTPIKITNVIYQGKKFIVEEKISPQWCKQQGQEEMFQTMQNMFQIYCQQATTNTVQIHDSQDKVLLIFLYRLSSYSTLA